MVMGFGRRGGECEPAVYGPKSPKIIGHFGFHGIDSDTFIRLLLVVYAR